MGAGAVNQRPGSAATWMPKSVPLRAMIEIMLESGMPAAGSSEHLLAAIERLRKK